MERKHVENLSILCLYMERLSDSGFDMREFFHPCGSPSCALGWACTIPELMKAGLKADAPAEGVGLVFGDVYGHLFHGINNSHIKTPQAWADHCRAFLREHGHEVVAPADKFKRFMERVMKPIPIEYPGQSA